MSVIQAVNGVECPPPFSLISSKYYAVLSLEALLNLLKTRFVNQSEFLAVFRINRPLVPTHIPDDGQYL